MRLGFFFVLIIKQQQMQVRARAFKSKTGMSFTPPLYVFNGFSGAFLVSLIVMLMGFCCFMFISQRL